MKRGINNGSINKRQCKDGTTEDTVTYDGEAWKGRHNLLPNVFNAEDTKTE